MIHTNVMAHRIPTSSTTSSPSWFGVAEAARCNVPSGLLCLELARSGLNRSSIGHRASEGDACVMLAAMTGLYTTPTGTDALLISKPQSAKGSSSSSSSGEVALVEAIERLYKDLATTVDPLCRYSRLQSAIILVRSQVEMKGRDGGVASNTTPFSHKFLLQLQNDLLSFIPQPKSNTYSSSSSTPPHHQLQEVIQWLSSFDVPLPLRGGERWVDLYCRTVIHLIGVESPTDGTSHPPRTSVLRRAAHLLLTVQPWNAPQHQQGRPEVLSDLVTALSQVGRNAAASADAAGGLEWRVALSLLSAHSQAAKASFVPHTANLTNGRTGLSTPCYSCHRIVKSIQRHQVDMGQNDPHRRAPGAVAWLVQEALSGMSSRPDLREAAALGRYCQQVIALHDVSASIQTNEDEDDADLLLLVAGTVSAVTFPEAITKLITASSAIKGRGIVSSGGAPFGEGTSHDEFLRSVGSVLSPQHGGGIGAAAPWSRALAALAEVSHNELVDGVRSSTTSATALLAPVVLYRMLYHYRQNDFDLTRPRPVQQAAIVAVQREATAVSELSSSLMDPVNEMEKDVVKTRLRSIAAPSLPHALVPLFQLCASHAPSSLTHVDPRSGRVQGYESGRRLLELAVARGDLESGRQLVAVLKSLGSTTNTNTTTSPIQSISWPTHLIRHIHESTTEVVPTTTLTATATTDIAPLSVQDDVIPSTTTIPSHTPTTSHIDCVGSDGSLHMAESSRVTPLESLYQEAEKCLKDVQRAQIRSLNLGSDRRVDNRTDSRTSRSSMHSANDTWVKSMALLASSQTMLSTPNGPAPPSMVAVALQCTLHACQWAVAAAIWRHVHSSAHALGTTTSQNSSTPPTTEPVGSFITFETKLGLALLRQQVHQAQEDEHKCNRLMMAQSMATQHSSPPFEAGFGGGEPLFTGFGNRGVVTDGSSYTAPNSSTTSTDEESRALALVADLTMRTYIMAEAWDDAVRYFHNLVANPPTPSTTATTKTATTRSPMAKSSSSKGVLTVRPTAKTTSAVYPSRHADMTIRPGSIALEAALMACTYASSEARRLADDVRCIAGVLEDIVTIGSKLMVHVRRVFAIRSDELEALGDDDGLSCHRDLRDGCTDGYLGGRVGGRTRSRGSRTARRGVDTFSSSVLLTHHNKDDSTQTATPPPPSESDSVDISLDDDDDFFVPTAGVHVLGHRQGPK